MCVYRKIIRYLISFILLIAFSTCKQKKNETKSDLSKPLVNSKDSMYNKEKQSFVKNKTLINGIDLDHVPYENVIKNIGKFEFNGLYLEDIKINKLIENTEYRNEVFLFETTSEKWDSYQKRQNFFIELLITNIYQNYDLRIYMILNLMCENHILLHEIQNYSDALLDLFMLRPQYFMNAYIKTKGKNPILSAIFDYSYSYSEVKEFLLWYNGLVTATTNTVLIKKDYIDQCPFPYLKTTLLDQPKMEYWGKPVPAMSEEKPNVFYGYNIWSLLYPEHLKTNHPRSIAFFQEIRKYLDAFVIKRRYYIQDEDGYTNLREAATTSSKILTQIPTNEEIEVMQDLGNWYKIKYKNIVGYVHQSRVIGGLMEK